MKVKFAINTNIMDGTATHGEFHYPPEIRAQDHSYAPLAKYDTSYSHDLGGK